MRLFGGKRKLVERVKTECVDLGVAPLAWAPASLAAVGSRRSRASNGFAKPWSRFWTVYPSGLTHVSSHQATLARLGCKTLGDVRALPRGGLSRRFDAELLRALDQAYGLLPEAHEWATLPEDFHMKMELMSRVEMAPAMLFGARRLSHADGRAGWQRGTVASPPSRCGGATTRCGRRPPATAANSRFAPPSRPATSST